MDYHDTIKKLTDFRDSRDWNKYHSLISLARALEIESSEVNKVFLWKTSDSDLSEKDIENLKLEIADVLTYTYYMCDKLGTNPNELVDKKLQINKKRHWKFDEK